MDIGIKRVYEPAAKEDGRRVLVDRLWPRGVSRQEARLDEWRRDIAPSPSLRAWFGHKRENFERFSEMYRLELGEDFLKQSAVRHLLEIGRAEKLTLLYGAKNQKINHAVVLKEYLTERAGRP